MDYLQYRDANNPNKPVRETGVLNLIINGLPSIRSIS